MQLRVLGCGLPEQAGQEASLLLHRSGTCDLPSCAAPELGLWLGFLTLGPVSVHAERSHSAGPEDSHVAIPAPEWLLSGCEQAARCQHSRPSCLRLLPVVLLALPG